jgi:putative sterol carrier protein
LPKVAEVFQLIDATLREDAARAQGMNAVYQFNLTGEEEGTYQVVLRPEGSFVNPGDQESSDCTLTMDSEDFKKLVEGDLNGTQAFMTGRLRIDGDMGLALRLQDILSAYNNAS